MEPDVASPIEAAEKGHDSAILCAKLHRSAKRELARRGRRVTLEATTLLHQAYIEMADKDGAAFPDRARFMGYASRVMRGLIIAYSRSRSAQKCGGVSHITSLDSIKEKSAKNPDLVRIDEARRTDHWRASPSQIGDMRFSVDSRSARSRP